MANDLLSDADKMFLLEAMRKGKVSLFLGAGFSVDSVNILNERVPGSRQLVEKLWPLTKSKEPFSDKDDLKEVFQLALNRASKPELLKLLRDCFDVKKAPSWMSLVSTFTWRKIFTTNIDNSLDKVFSYGQPLQKLVVIDGVMDNLVDRDQSFKELLLVHLHGSLKTPAENLTFGVSQYGDRGNWSSDPWYSDFVHEYIFNPVIFIGSSLNEPLFWKFLEARGPKGRDNTELRSRGFVVCRDFSSSKAELLKEYNLVPINATAEEFFVYLNSILEPRPDLRELIRLGAPNFIPVIDAEVHGAETKLVKALGQFFQTFQKISPQPPSQSFRKKMYHQGKHPEWQDLTHNLDAVRAVTADIQNNIMNALKEKRLEIHLLHGSAGAGKSTVAKRLALNCYSAGATVLFSEEGVYPPIAEMSKALEFLDGPLVFVIDNAQMSFRGTVQLTSLMKAMSKVGSIFLVTRSSHAGNLIDEIEKEIKVHEYSIERLVTSEIDGLIQVLDNNGMLGKLKGKGLEEQRKIFEEKAKKQILVAMREATEGKGFDEIIRNEFIGIVNSDARMLYVLASLMTAHGHFVTKDVLIEAFGLAPSQCLNILARELKNIVIPREDDENKLIARHRLIAVEVIDRIAARSDLKDAYIELLRIVTKQVGQGSLRQKQLFKLYKELISHETLIRRFISDRDSGRAIYGSLEKAMKNDYHFWLQYGLFELSDKNVELAENYINQAIGICESNGRVDPYVTLTRSNILIQKALLSRSPEAFANWEKEIEVLKKYSESEGKNDPYPFHVLGLQMRHWARVKIQDKAAKLKLLNSAREIVEKGRRRFPRDNRLKELSDLILKNSMQESSGLPWDDGGWREP
jgi:hypothetical protein